jgi:hypothetical protein
VKTWIAKISREDIWKSSVGPELEEEVMTGGIERYVYLPAILVVGEERSSKKSETYHIVEMKRVALTCYNHRNLSCRDMDNRASGEREISDPVESQMRYGCP